MERVGVHKVNAMDIVLPVIYGGGTVVEPRGAPRWARVTSLTVSILCLAALSLASWLTPSPRGEGTHEGLGLAPCQFLARTGLPCPSCGMTTSFTWFAHGNLAASLYVQPMGTALAIVAGFCVWGGLYVALTGRPVYRLLRLVPGQYYLLPLLALGVMAWAWKILIHLRGLDGWS